MLSPSVKSKVVFTKGERKKRMGPFTETTQLSSGPLHRQKGVIV